MKKLQSDDGSGSAPLGLVEGLGVLSGEMLGLANRGVLRAEFLKKVTHLLLEFSLCDVIEIRLREGVRFFRCEERRDVPGSFHFETIAGGKQNSRSAEIERGSTGLVELSEMVENGEIDPSSKAFTRKGSFWTGDTRRKMILPLLDRTRKIEVCFGDDCLSLALIPFKLGDDISGSMLLKSKHLDHFRRERVELFEQYGQTLVIAAAHRRSNVLLRERVKELTCLYGIAHVAAQPDVSLDEILQRVVELMPPAFVYPDIASATISLNGKLYSTSNGPGGIDRLTAEIIIGAQQRGRIEVVYAEARPTIDEGPFLREERHLIETIAREVAVIAERKQTEEEKMHLVEQLNHADRLSTVGQLAAGVAHELNEPLGAILGYSQLALKNEQTPLQLRQDLQRTVAASLHAREIVKKLVLFARQVPLQKRVVNLNQVVEESLYFLSSRCDKEGIRLEHELECDLPDTIADPSQLQQVIVNLVVNAIQAMPQGGVLTIRSAATESTVLLTVEDTGDGMSEDVLKQIFTPFFTTKPVGQGTGLGLPVVHGIVTSHGGSIHVESTPGKGTRFEIRFPIAVHRLEVRNQHD